MKHLTDEELSACLDDALPSGAASEAERHLATCDVCRMALASLAAQDEALRPVLEHDPGEAYFESFPARVEDRIRAAGLRGAQSKAWDAGWLWWLRSPRRLATAGVLAAAIGGAAIVVVTARMERPEPRVLLDHPSATRSAPEPEASKDEATQLKLRNEGARSDQAAKEASGSAAPLNLKLAKERGTVEEQTAQAPTTAAPAPAASQPAVPRRAQAAPPRTDAGGPASTPYGFATPPSAAGGETKTLASRKATPAQEERAKTLARDEAGSKMMANTAPEAGEGQAQLCGRVLDAKGRAVSGAQVALADLGTTTATDSEGKFCFSAPAGTHEVTVLAMGYQESRFQARAGASSDLQVKLRPVPVLDSGSMTGNTSLWRQSGSAIDAFAKAPVRVRAQVREAQTLFAKAQASGSASDYDAAAARWQKLVPGRIGAEAQEARFRLAEARYRAWEASPNATRSRAASDALIAFLRYANTGPQREQAASWLARVLR